MTTATASKRRAAGSRVSTPKALATNNPAVFMSAAQQQELAVLDKTIAQITSSKKEALAFLKDAGIFNSSGKLARIYRTA